MGISAEQVMSLVSLLLVLVFWLMILQNKRARDRALNDALIRREQELEAERQRHAPKPAENPETPDREKSGPWG